MLNKLGRRTLEQRRADARLCLFYKIVYGLVAVRLPDHVQYSHRISRYCHSMTFRQVYTSRDYYKYFTIFYALAIVQWNALPESIMYAYRVRMPPRLLSVSCNILDHNHTKLVLILFLANSYLF